MILYLVHGWGFDASLWSGLARLLPERRVAIADRGYFATPHAPVPEEPCIAVTHSFGTMLVLDNPPPMCRGLVAINGFDCFTAREGFPGVAPRVVERMLARLDADPAAVLADFRRRCGSDAPLAEPDARPLRQDLLALRDMDCRAEASRWKLPILSLQGASDPILPPAMRDAVFASAPQADRVTHPSAGHVLPASDAEFCARQIRAFVELVR